MVYGFTSTYSFVELFIFIVVSCSGIIFYSRVWTIVVVIAQTSYGSEPDDKVTTISIAFHHRIDKIKTESVSTSRIEMRMTVMSMITRNKKV